MIHPFGEIFSNLKMENQSFKINSPIIHKKTKPQIFKILFYNLIFKFITKSNGFIKIKSNHFSAESKESYQES